MIAKSESPDENDGKHPFIPLIKKWFVLGCTDDKHQYELIWGVPEMGVPLDHPCL